MAARVGDVLRSLLFYAAFYGGTAVLVLVAFAAMPIGRGPFLRVVKAWMRYHRACVTGLLGIRVQIEGVLPERDTLVAMKHESFFEAIDLGVLFHQPIIFAKAELLRIPLWGKVGRVYGLVPVERSQGARALRSMIAAARAQKGGGRVFVIFPEGTRVPHGTRAPLQAGFAALYKLLDLPVVPVAVDSGPLYHRWWKLSGTITVRVGEPLPPGLPRAEIEAQVHAGINALNREVQTKAIAP